MTVWIGMAIAGAGMLVGALLVLIGYHCGLKTSVMAHRLANGQDPLEKPKPIDGKAEETG